MSSEEYKSALIEGLKDELCDLALIFRSENSRKKSVEAQKIAEVYQSVVYELLELGWDCNIDIECELPSEYYPPEFFERIPEQLRKIKWG